METIKQCVILGLIVAACVRPVRGTGREYILAKRELYGKLGAFNKSRQEQGSDDVLTIDEFLILPEFEEHGKELAFLTKRFMDELKELKETTDPFLNNKESKQVLGMRRKRILALEAELAKLPAVPRYTRSEKPSFLLRYKMKSLEVDIEKLTSEIKELTEDNCDDYKLYEDRQTLIEELEVLQQDYRKSQNAATEEGLSRRYRQNSECIARLINSQLGFGPSLRELPTHGGPLMGSTHGGKQAQPQAGGTDATTLTDQSKTPQVGNSDELSLEDQPQ